MLQELFECLTSFWIWLLVFLGKAHLITYLIAHLGPYLMKFLVFIKITYSTTTKALDDMLKKNSNYKSTVRNPLFSSSEKLSFTCLIYYTVSWCIWNSHHCSKPIILWFPPRQPPDLMDSASKLWLCSFTVLLCQDKYQCILSRWELCKNDQCMTLLSLCVFVVLSIKSG